MAKSEEQKKQDEIKRKIKEDKIFNNGYKAGEGLRDDSEYIKQSEISVNSGYSDRYLQDVYEAEDHISYDLGIAKIFEIIENDPDLKQLLKKKDVKSKLKLSKEETNWCFHRILKNVEKMDDVEQFFNPIYILEVLSSILNINSNDPIKDYRKIFDCLDVEIQEDLVNELNKKYQILEGKVNKRNIH